MGGRGKQQLLFATLVVACVSGCASSRVPVLPGGGDEGYPEPENVHVIEVGNAVKVTTSSGEVVRGEVIDVSETCLVVGQVGNFGYSERKVEPDSIRQLEWIDGGNIWPFIGLATAGFFAWVIHGLSKLN